MSWPAILGSYGEQEAPSGATYTVFTNFNYSINPGPNLELVGTAPPEFSLDSHAGEVSYTEPQIIALLEDIVDSVDAQDDYTIGAVFGSDETATGVRGINTFEWLGQHGIGDALGTYYTDPTPMATNISDFIQNFTGAWIVFLPRVHAVSQKDDSTGLSPVGCTTYCDGISVGGGGTNIQYSYSYTIVKSEA